MDEAPVISKKKRVKLSDDPDNLDSKPDQFDCPYCTALLSSYKNLQRHIRDVHSMETIPMICVDVVNGLYVTPKHEHSPVFPIHVVKSTNPPKIDCEVENCQKFMQIARSSGNPVKECVHLERTKHAKQYAKPAVLQPASLKDMLSKGLIPSDWGGKCEKLDFAAKTCGVDSVFPVFFGGKGSPERWLFFSVFTNETDTWCQFGRTRVTFDSVAGKWNCQCKGSEKTHRCIHRMMAMWWIFQESPSTVMAMSDVQVEDIDDLESHMLDGGTSSVQQNMNTQKICAMTTYIYTQKRIPCLQDLPLKLRTKEETPPTCFKPTEMTCPYCPGPTPPELCPSKVVTTQATVYGIDCVKKGISVAEKECPVCGNIVRFQEYSSGFHNFNNNVLLTLPLCELLLSGLMNMTTSGQMLETLSLFNDNRYHHQTVRKAFHHFLSLTDFDFDFSCYQCGYHPSVIIADANMKLAFDIPLGTFKRPDPDTISDVDLQIDIVKAWSDLDKAIVAEGLISGTAVANPYCTSTHHSTLAPWMGQHTRVGNILPKTEIKKALKKKPDHTTQPTKQVNEDSILELVESKKHNKKDLQEACLALGVSPDGSIADLLNRLQELLNFKDVYPELFLKLQKAGGGVLHFSCMHGVVYYLNVLFWMESARDHGDGLLSFKYLPTCYISDIAGQVARHTNNRTEQLFFQPHDGRLCAPTPENLKKAAQKELNVQLDWVKNLRFPLPQNASESSDRMTAKHPITRTCERYSLYDRFHQKNQKRPEEKLRGLNICPELRKEVNSAVAEQFNRELASVRYSLCQMTETQFKQTLRVLIHLHNDQINRNFKKEMEEMCHAQLSVGLHGMLGLQSPEEIKTIVSTEHNQNNNPDSSVTSSFVAQRYTVDDKSKEKLKTLLSGRRDENQALAHATRRFPVTIKDIASVCTLELLEEVSWVMPWLTDDAVNYRVAQLVQESGCTSLGTFDYILWHREWTKSGTVNDQLVKQIPMSGKIFLPRIVGDSFPETGNHLILWVFDFTSKDIRIYDSLSLHTTIDEKDMALLRNVFRSSGGLQDWTLTFPPQWKQQDSFSCGIFLCSAVENEVQKHSVTVEPLTLNQCRTLRIHHASQMIRNIDPEDFPRTLQETIAMKEKEKRIQQTELKDTDSSIHCLAWKIRACLFQRATGKTSLFHEHVKKYQWVQCTTCKNWLHFQCAGLPEDWNEGDFFCGCSLSPDINNVLQSAKPEDILTDSEIKELEKKLQAGDILSNRMYLWKHKGFDPLLRKLYSEHVTTFNDMMTELLITRLKNILNVPGSGVVDQHMVTEVILPEVVIQWLQTHNLCRYQAETMLMNTVKEKEGLQKIQEEQATEKGSSIIVDSQAAADWCKEQKF